MVDGVGFDISRMFRLGRGVHHRIFALFPLLSCLQKVRNGSCERGCEVKLIPKKLSLSG